MFTIWWFSELIIKIRLSLHLGKEMANYSSILRWETHGQRRLLGNSSWGRKELDTTEQLNNNNQNKISWHISHITLLACVYGENI